MTKLPSTKYQNLPLPSQTPSNAIATATTINALTKKHTSRHRP